MAKAKKLPSGNWRVQVYSHTHNGKKIYKSFTAPTKREAEFKAAQFAMEKRDISGSSMTLEKAMEMYIQNRESVLSPKTIREYRNLLKNNYDYIKDIKICDLTQSDVQKEMNSASKHLAPKTVRNLHGLLSATLKEYRPGFTLATTLPKKKKPELYIPTEEEIRLLLDYVANTDMEVPIMLAAFGPMRRGEICALTSEDIDGNTIHVNKAMALNEQNQWIIKQPKTTAGIRNIDFPDFVINAINPVSGRVVNMNPAMLSNRFRRLIRKIPGITPFRFHDLRHYCASFLHAKGLPDKFICERAGWESDLVLKNVYLHMLSDENELLQERTKELFSETFGESITRNITQKNKDSLD